MPSKQDICVVAETMATPKDFFPSDVEDLVAAIKHNLQLKSRPCHSVCSKQKRMSPYAVPVRTLCRKACDKENTTEHSSDTCKYCRARSKSPVTDQTTDDPYEMLQELIREGSLIKEAVKRLQLGSHTAKSKKTDFYEAEDFDAIRHSPRLCDF